MGITGLVSWVANLRSSAELPPFFGAEGFLGESMSLDELGAVTPSGTEHWPAVVQ